MNENAKKWIAALRSGEFQQTTSVLTRVNEDGKVTGHCCLGVACELAVDAGVAENLGDTDTEGAVAYADTDGDISRIQLPYGVMDWLGMKDPYGGLPSNDDDDDSPGSLSDANDGGASFERIADLIEDNARYLFTE